MWTMTALETGVDRKADLVLLKERPVEKGRIGISNLAYENTKQKRLWMAVRKRSGRTTDECTVLTRGPHDDIMVTDMKRIGEMITRIINVYDQKDVQTGERRTRKLN